MHGEMGTDLRSLLSSNIPFMNVPVAPPVRREVDVDVGRQQLCVEHGIHLLDGPVGRGKPRIYPGIDAQGRINRRGRGRFKKRQTQNQRSTPAVWAA